MPDDEAITRDQVKADLLTAIHKMTTAEVHENDASQILKFAEAWAWIAIPNMPHGESALSA